jgi:hypothetical protein
MERHRQVLVNALSLGRPILFWLSCIIGLFSFDSARNPLGYVEYYAPALACKLRLLHI